MQAHDMLMSGGSNLSTDSKSLLFADGFYSRMTFTVSFTLGCIFSVMPKYYFYNQNKN